MQKVLSCHQQSVLTSSFLKSMLMKHNDSQKCAFSLEKQLIPTYRTIFCCIFVEENKKQIKSRSTDPFFLEVLQFLFVCFVV